MTPSRLMFPDISQQADSCRRPVYAYLVFWIAAILSTAVCGSAPDTTAQKPVADSTSAYLPPVDSTNASDSIPLPDTAKTPVSNKAPDSTTDTLAMAINFDSCMIMGAGIGLSVGSIPIFSLWESGLPQSLAGFNIQDSSLRHPTDSSLLAFSLEENPDIYNMVFPVSVSFGRCFEQGRVGGAISFSMISKKYASAIVSDADSLKRIDVRNRLSLYTLTLDLLYGMKIPYRYFSVDGVDRTDAIIGISIAPLLALKKSSSLQSRSPDLRFTAIANSLQKGIPSFSSYGMAFGWRAGIVTLRRLANQGGVEAGISYFGVWSGRFRSSGSPLLEQQVSRNGSAKKETGAISHRIEISVALVRKVF